MNSSSTITSTYHKNFNQSNVILHSTRLAIFTTNTPLSLCVPYKLPVTPTKNTATKIELSRQLIGLFRSYFGELLPHNPSTQSLNHAELISRFFLFPCTIPIHSNRYLILDTCGKVQRYSEEHGNMAQWSRFVWDTFCKDVRGSIHRVVGGFIFFNPYILYLYRISCE